METRLKAGVLIVSDTAAKDPDTDTVGNVLRSTFDEDGGGNWEVTEVKIVPDSIADIQRSVLQWSDGAHAVNLIITSGGTGFATKDNTPEVYLYIGSSKLVLIARSGNIFLDTQTCSRSYVSFTF